MESISLTKHLWRKYLTNNFQMKIFRRHISDENIRRRNMYDKNIVDGIFLTKILLINSAPQPRYHPRAARSSQNLPVGQILLLARFMKYLWRKYCRRNISGENISTKYLWRRYCRRNISGEDIVDQIFLTKILLINSPPPPSYHPRAARSSQNLPWRADFAPRSL